MLDAKKVGTKISSLRKSFGCSQEKLAELLCVTPQAVSKWENGHTLPDTSLLPVLAQIFECSIDNIIMPAYSLDKKVKQEKPGVLEQQAEHIAKYVFKKMEDKQMQKEHIGLSDDIIVDSVLKKHSIPASILTNIKSVTVNKGKLQKQTAISVPL